MLSGVALGVIALEGHAQAATCTWQSMSNSAWSTVANWSCGHVPTATDDVVFPGAAGLQYSVVDDINVYQVQSVSVTGGFYNFSGTNTLNVTTSIASSSPNDAVFLIPIQLSGAATVSNTGAGVLQFQIGKFGLGLNTGSVVLSGTGRIELLGVVSGQAALSKIGTGTLVLGGNNNFSSTFDIANGVVQLASGTALGDNVGTTKLEGGAKLQLVAPGGYTVSEPIAINAAGSPAIESLGAANTWSGAITLVNATTIACTSNLTLSGALSGAGSVSWTGGAGSLCTLSAPNFGYTGSMTVKAGPQLVVSNATALGAGGTLIVESGGAVLLTASSLSNPLSLNGPGNGTSPTLRAAALNSALSGLITLGDATVVVDVPLGDAVNASAGLTGGGALNKSGPGVLTLNHASTYLGATNVLAGTLKSGSTNAIPDGSFVTLAAGSLLNLSDFSELIGALAGQGDVALGFGSLSVSPAQAATFGGSVSGTGGLKFLGTGSETWTGSSAHSGATAVQAGTVLLSGGTWSASDVTVSGGALQLSNHGTIVKSLNVQSGTLSPGAALPRNGASGNLNLSAPSLFVAQCDGIADGKFSQLAVTGSVTLASGALNVSLGYLPEPGDSFTIIDNDGTDPVSGTFNALPEGATAFANGVPMKISYLGGTGNDVVLSVIASTGSGGAGNGGGGGSAGVSGNNAGGNGGVSGANMAGGDAGESSAGDANLADAGDAGASSSVGGSTHSAAGSSNAAGKAGASSTIGDAGADATGEPGTANGNGSTPSSGCGCRSAGGERNVGASVLLMLAGLVLARRRRSVRCSKQHAKRVDPRGPGSTHDASAARNDGARTSD